VLLFDLQTLLRTQPNPLTPAQVFRLRGLRPGPPPRPSLEPVTVERLADASGTICIARQRIGCGHAFARQTAAHVSETTIAVELGDGDTHTVRRTTTTTVTTIGATDGYKNLAPLSHISWHRNGAHQPSQVGCRSDRQSRLPRAVVTLVTAVASGRAKLEGSALMIVDTGVGCCRSRDGVPYAVPGVDRGWSCAARWRGPHLG
jgi:hypothetical protein